MDIKTWMKKKDIMHQLATRKDVIDVIRAFNADLKPIKGYSKLSKDDLFKLTKLHKTDKGELVYMIVMEIVYKRYKEFIDTYEKPKDEPTKKEDKKQTEQLAESPSLVQLRKKPMPISFDTLYQVWRIVRKDSRGGFVIRKTRQVDDDGLPKYKSNWEYVADPRKRKWFEYMIIEFGDPLAHTLKDALKLTNDKFQQWFYWLEENLTADVINNLIKIDREANK
jgi:hypothetical protein